MSFRRWWNDIQIGDMGEHRISGLAGTGKSTIVAHLLEATGLRPDDVVFLAPTGKACKGLRKKLKEQDIKSEASTIHSAIYHPKVPNPDTIEQQIEMWRKKLNGGDPFLDEHSAKEYQDKIAMAEETLSRIYKSDDLEFLLNPDSQKLDGKRLIIMDEASMVDEQIAKDLRGFGIPILAIGDPGQLPPVNGLPGFDLAHADSFLSEIHRQAADNPIIRMAHDLRKGKRPHLGSHGDGRLRVVTPEGDDATFDQSRDVQVICGSNRKRWEITREIRFLSGIGPVGPVTGEMMICTRNSRTNTALVNGAMFLVTEDVGELMEGSAKYKMKLVDDEGKNHAVTCVQAILEENYRGKGGASVNEKMVYRAKMQASHFDWAYAITCHKSQGSQWDEVVVHDESWMFKQDARCRSSRATSSPFVRASA